MKIKYSCIIAAVMILSAFVPLSFAQQKGDVRLGILVLIGGRYDDLRMCVASKSGTKGGMIADLMLTGRYAIKDQLDIGFNVPVMRPILFGLAFKMVQFEPEMVLEIKKRVNNNIDFFAAPSLGISFHYGPDYKSDRINRSSSFFAAGPIAGIHLGAGFKDGNGMTKNLIGIKPFYASLLTRGHGTGTVIGGALEYQHAW